MVPSHVAKENSIERMGYPSCCQLTLSITALVVGVIVALCGVFAFCAIKGKLPINAAALERFKVIGLTNSYFVMGGGAALTLLAAAATIHLFERAGGVAHAQEDPAL